MCAVKPPSLYSIHSNTSFHSVHAILPPASNVSVVKDTQRYRAPVCDMYWGVPRCTQHSAHVCTVCCVFSWTFFCLITGRVLFCWLTFCSVFLMDSWYVLCVFNTIKRLKRLVDESCCCYYPFHYYHSSLSPPSFLLLVGFFFVFFLRSPAISLGFTTFGWDFCVCDRFLIQPLR